MKRTAAAALILVIGLWTVTSQQPARPPAPLICRVQAECTMADYYTAHTPPGTIVAVRCSPIFCDVLLTGPGTRACVQTRYGVPWEVGFRPQSVCSLALD